MNTIPFDITKARTPENPNGLEVTDGYGTKIRIICTDIDSEYSIAAIQSHDDCEDEVQTYTMKGVFDKDRPGSSSNLLLIDNTEHIAGCLVKWGVFYKDVRGQWTPYHAMYSSCEEAQEKRDEFRKNGTGARLVKMNVYYMEDER